MDCIFIYHASMKQFGNLASVFIFVDVLAV